jgi:hypothetical protein
MVMVILNRTYLILPRFLCISMALMDQKVVWQDIKINARNVDTKQTSGFVSAVPHKPLVAPVSDHLISILG